MSLGSWFRDYIYIPLGGNRVPKWRWVMNILVVWMLTGLWHGASWNFVLWGLLYAAVLLAEKWIPGLQKLPDLLKHIYVMLVVILGFVLFNAETLGQAAGDIAGLFGFAGLPFLTPETLYYLRSYGLLFVLGFVGSTPVVRSLARRVSETKPGAVLEPAVLIVLLLLCTGYLVDGSFSPFLYFRF
jgi:alginate O-acetyltransferase complex protein AlgI